MPERIDIEATTKGDFTKRLAWIDLDVADSHELHYGEDDNAVNILSDSLIVIDVTKLPKELKTIRIKVS